MYLLGSVIVLLVASLSLNEASSVEYSHEFDVSVTFSSKGSAKVVLESAVAYWTALAELSQKLSQRFSNLAYGVQGDSNSADLEFQGFCQQARALLQAFRAAGGRITPELHEMLSSQRSAFYEMHSNFTSQLQSLQTSYQELVVRRLTSALECALKRLQALEALRASMNTMTEEQVKAAIEQLMQYRAQFFQYCQQARDSFYLSYNEAQGCVSKFRNDMYVGWMTLNQIISYARRLQFSLKFEAEFGFGSVDSSTTASSLYDASETYYSSSEYYNGDYSTDSYATK